MIGKRIKINSPQKIPVTPKEMKAISEEGIRRVAVPERDYQLNDRIGFLEYRKIGKRKEFTGKEVQAYIKEVHKKTEVTFRVQAIIQERVGKPASY